MHAEHTHRKRVLLGERSLAEQGVGHWHPRLFSKGLGCLVAARGDAAAAQVEQGTLAAAQEIRGGFEQLGRGFGLPSVTRQVHLLGKVGGAFGEGVALGDVLGQIDEHWPLAAGGGDVECLGHYAGDVVGVSDQIGVLDDGHGDAKDIGLLKGVFAEHGGDGLAGEGDDGRRIHQRG